MSKIADAFRDPSGLGTIGGREIDQPGPGRVGTITCTVYPPMAPPTSTVVGTVGGRQISSGTDDALREYAGGPLGNFGLFDTPPPKTPNNPDGSEGPQIW